VPLRDVQEAASHADPRTTMRYDRARTSLDRHATYIVAAFIAGAARYPQLPGLNSAWPPSRGQTVRTTSAVTNRHEPNAPEPPIGTELAHGRLACRARGVGCSGTTAIGDGKSAALQLLRQTQRLKMVIMARKDWLGSQAVEKIADLYVEVIQCWKR
jgi:hypothetical protein